MKKKWYTLGEITDEFVGEKRPEREAFDADVEAALIGASIKNARKAMNLTQAQLGERVGVQTAQISKIESGRNLTISTIVRVLKALGLSANFSINCEGLTLLLSETEYNRPQIILNRSEGISLPLERFVFSR